MTCVHCSDPVYCHESGYECLLTEASWMTKRAWEHLRTLVLFRTAEGFGLPAAWAKLLVNGYAHMDDNGRVYVTERGIDHYNRWGAHVNDLLAIVAAVSVVAFTAVLLAAATKVTYPWSAQVRACNDKGGIYVRVDSGTWACQ